MREAESVTFGGGGWDRAAQNRPMADALAKAPDACVLPFWRGKPLIRGAEGGQLALAALTAGAPALAEPPGTRVYLGRDGPRDWFALDISDWAAEGHDAAEVNTFHDPSEQRYPGLPADHRFLELRGAMTGLTARDAECAATARAVLNWHRSHRFCANCGAESALADAGWTRLCPACGRRHFPRTDPVVIMLVTRGNSVLLGRSPAWPERMYSLLAGFIEPGETVEAAVRRETFEEAGIRVGPVRYLASQPWPFPASLMIGCHGEATTAEITRDPAELEDAIWVTKEELLAIHAGESDRLSPARPGAIARFLLDRWLADRLA